MNNFEYEKKTFVPKTETVFYGTVWAEVFNHSVRHGWRTEEAVKIATEQANVAWKLAAEGARED